MNSTSPIKLKTLTELEVVINAGNSASSNEIEILLAWDSWAT